MSKNWLFLVHFRFLGSISIGKLLEPYPIFIFVYFVAMQVSSWILFVRWHENDLSGESSCQRLRGDVEKHRPWLWRQNQSAQTQRSNSQLWVAGQLFTGRFRDDPTPIRLALHHHLLPSLWYFLKMNLNKSKPVKTRFKTDISQKASPGNKAFMPSNSPDIITHTLLIKKVCLWSSPGSASWCLRTSSPGEWPCLSPCSWCWSTSSTAWPQILPKPKVLPYFHEI